MEKRRNALSYLMIMLCICMQMAMAYPHHHHSDSICVKTDLVNDHSGACSETEHHHHANDGDKHSCSSLCITKFECGTTHHLWHLTPIYSFYTVIYTPAANVLSKLHAQSAPTAYIERLHAQSLICVQKFRAPPVLG